MKRPGYILVHDPARPAPRRSSHPRRAAGATGTPATLGLTLMTGDDPADAGPPAATRVGIWDLGAWLGGLPRLIEGLNAAQSTIRFFEVKATVPPGLISRPERTVAWLDQVLAKKPSPADRRDIVDNLIANDFFGLAERVRKDLAIDYVVGLTPSMVAGEDDDEIYWNHFSTFSKRTILASTYDLRRFAAETEIPFERFVGGIVVAQVLVAICHPPLGFHDNRGCLFDYNADRDSIKNVARDVRIEPSCMKLVRPPFRDAAGAMVNFLRTFEKE